MSPVFPRRTRPGTEEMRASTQARISQLASLRCVHEAFRWLHLQEQRIAQWQRTLVGIPAPPFMEQARAQWMTDQFRALGLHGAHVDDCGNAVASLLPDDEASPIILLSAHLDTVFPQDVAIEPREEDGILYAPGACDNGAGLAALLAIAAALSQSGAKARTNIVFAANTGEEAEGNLRGMRWLFDESPFRGRICSSIALEGAGTGTVVSRALGSRRFRVEIVGPGGHAWTDSGAPSPMVALAEAITTVSRDRPPLDPRTSINFGTVSAGTSVTAVPQSATALVDIRSVDPDQMLLREVQLFRAVEDAVLAANRAATAGTLTFAISLIGDRPAGELASSSALMQTVRAVDRHLRIRTEDRLGSTDANIPLSLGLDGIAMGAGGTGGGIHTTREWYNPAGRQLALRRILLTVMDLCHTEESDPEDLP